MNSVRESPEEKSERLKKTWLAFKEKHGQKAPQPQVISVKLLKIRRHGVTGKKKQNGDLKEFWARFFPTMTLDEKIQLLRDMAEAYTRKIAKRKLRKKRATYMRRRFNLLTLKDTWCLACGAPAEHRHHVIPLGNGGRNSPLNMCGLCEACHEAVHPWMKDKRWKSK